LQDVYRGLGIDLPAFNGDDSWQLPLPARIVVDTHGIIRALDADPDYTRRPEPEATLEVLRTL
jgi:peroxiredoxin